MPFESLRYISSVMNGHEWSNAVEIFEGKGHDNLRI